MNIPNDEPRPLERRVGPDWVIQIDGDGPMFVNENEWCGFVRNITQAELYSTENEARENMNAFMRNNPDMKCWIKPHRPNARVDRPAPFEVEK